MSKLVNCDSDALHIRLVRNCNGKVTGFSDESFRMMGLGSEEITGSQVLAGVEFLAEKLVLENHRASKAVIPFQQELTAMGLLDSTARRSSASRKKRPKWSHSFLILVSKYPNVIVTQPKIINSTCLIKRATVCLQQSVNRLWLKNNIVNP